MTSLCTELSRTFKFTADRKSDFYMEYVYSGWLKHLYAHANFYFIFTSTKVNIILFFHQKSLR